MSDGSAGIVLVVRNGLPALRMVLHGIRETVEQPYELVVLAHRCHEQDATYLLRQYLRGRIVGYQIDSMDEPGAHCDADHHCRPLKAEYLVRVDDSVEFQPGWLEKAVAALQDEPTIGCLSLVPPPDYHRGRGRPATVNVKPHVCSSMDVRCYVTRRALVDGHERELLVHGPDEACLFQAYLERSGLQLAYLPGLVKPLDLTALNQTPTAVALLQREDALPSHEDATGAMRRLSQAYALGDDVLLTCMACGGPELEVLAARIIFCRAHQVAVGFWYELRCPACGELHYKDDVQFDCPV